METKRKVVQIEALLINARTCLRPNETAAKSFALFLNCE